MHIDGLTMMVAGGLVAAAGCVVLLTAWPQLRPAPAILWWATGLLLNALAVAALVPGYEYSIPVLAEIGQGLIPLGATAIWSGARAFGGRSVPRWTFAAVVTIWAASGLLPVAGGPRTGWMLATLSLSTLLFTAAGVELWRGRAEYLPSRWPLIIVTLLHAAICAVGVADVALGLMSPDTVLSMSTGFGVMYFELIVFELATAVFVVMLYRERAYTVLTMAAGTDDLTGTANRGAFLIQAARLLRRAYANGEPASVIIFDLDHFKEINDRHGHAAGDRVLRSFAETARAVLRPGDLLGRLGGEEFAGMLPGAGTDAAFNIAERVRDAFEIATAVTVPSTVSAGVAAANSSLEAAMECADLALYRAKAVGRNRVERAPEPTPRKVSIVRVA